MVIELNWTTRVQAQLEMQMNSVERVQYFSTIPVEQQVSQVEDLPRKNWPSKGMIFGGFTIEISRES